MWNKVFSLWKKTHIVWNNWSGKTHILDAIHILGGAKNIYWNSKLENNDRIECFFGENFLEKNYTFANINSKENFLIQNKKISRPKYNEALPFKTVYVSPFDMNMLYFAPSVRRDYIDEILSKTYAQFSKIKKEYEQIMKQRNALLKKIREENYDENSLDFWDNKIAEISYTYGLYRKKYIDYISQKIPSLPDFFANYNIKIKYIWDWLNSENPENFVKNYLKENRKRDILSGHTHIGPHRDDFELWMQNDDWTEQNVQFFLSRWEMKMLLLGLKIIECDFVEKQTEKNIILLVDDIFAELDEKNIILFLNIIIQHQIILTSQKPLPNEINSEIFTCINLTNQ